MRVGVATAKALALGLSIPVVAVVSLDALALAAGPADREMLALRDARAGEALFAIYRANPSADAGPRRAPAAPCRPPDPARRSRRAGPRRSIRAYLEERGIAKVLAVGEDAERLAVTLPLTGLLAGVRTPAVTPLEILALARSRFVAGTTDDADALAPLYLQPSTPEKLLAAREAKKGGGA